MTNKNNEISILGAYEKIDLLFENLFKAKLAIVLYGKAKYETRILKLKEDAQLYMDEIAGDAMAIRVKSIIEKFFLDVGIKKVEFEITYNGPVMNVVPNDLYSQVITLILFGDLLNQ